MSSLPVNSSEAFVLEICQKSFLSLWCYNNPRAKIGKELCDILVVCDPHLIVISVKEIRLNQDKDPEVAHARWERKAVDSSVKQIYGAEGWLSKATEIIRSDGTPALALPAPDIRRIHRIAVALGDKGEVVIKSGDFGEGFVHVMTEESFRDVLTELDTITDLTDYLTAKERFAQNGSLIVCEGAESNMLGWYLRNDRTFPVGQVTIMFDATIWAGLQSDPIFKQRKEDDRCSYAWDQLAEHLADPTAKPIAGPGPELNQLEIALRTMARETRFNRRSLGMFISEFFATVRTTGSAARMMQGPSGIIYVFVYFPPGTTAEDRSHELQGRSFVARHLAGSGDTILAIGLSKPAERHGSASDIVYIHLPAWTSADADFATQIQEKLGYFADSTKKHYKVDEYRSPGTQFPNAWAAPSPETGMKNVKWLAEFLAEIPSPAAAYLRTDLLQNAALHCAVLAKSHQMAVKMEHVAETLHQARQLNAGENEPVVVHTIAALWGVLLVEYESSGASTEILDALEALHETALTRFLTVMAAQVDALCAWLISLRSSIRSLKEEHGRIFLVDLPIGNSLPVILLADILRAESALETIRVSLPRKESARKRLLQESFAKLKFQRGDLVVYLDEWSTGSNFKAICDVLRKLVPHPAALVAAAVMKDDSHLDGRYESVCKVHDKVMGKLNRNGAAFRVILPRTPTLATDAPYFFWAENDRMAGLRKMQVHGLVFSTIDEAVERLHVDRGALKQTISFLLAAMGSSKPPGQTDESLTNTLLASFETSYKDYVTCRDELKACGAEFSNGGLVDDFDSYLSVVLARYNAITENRDAREATMLGQMFLARFSDLDPGDRYRFDDHAPIIVSLTGRAKQCHEVVLGILRGRMEAILARS